EIDPGNVLQVDIEDSTPTFTPHRVGRWEFTTVEAYLANADDVEAFGERLSHLANKERTAVWLSLTGTLTTSQRARLDHLIDEFQDVFARIDLWQRHTDLVTVADVEDFADLGLVGFASDALDELTDLAEAGGAEAQTAQDALGLLYRLVAQEGQ
ncbi:MAG TPA: DNA repair exonuclease, partial [Beutenbergiaceae bacterium]|nr:DNA repair exonuclease [Beutenbergiaceae bacterium]